MARSLPLWWDTAHQRVGERVAEDASSTLDECSSIETSEELDDFRLQAAYSSTGAGDVSAGDVSEESASASAGEEAE